MTRLESMQRALRGEAVTDGELRFPSPIAELLGIRVTAVEDGAATLVMDVDERFANPMGTLHGGILADLADLAMGAAHATTLGEDETFTTLELKINFLRPVWKAHLIARARVAHRGRTITLVDCDIVQEDGKPIAKVTSTLLTLRGEAARGR